MTKTTAKPPMNIVYVDALHKNETGLRAAQIEGMRLVERGWLMYLPAGYDSPALLAFEGELCIGGIVTKMREGLNEVGIEFAWADRDRPAVFAALLLALRTRLKAQPVKRVTFCHHIGNAAMTKAVNALGLRPHSINYYFELAQSVQSHKEQSDQNDR